MPEEIMDDITIEYMTSQEAEELKILKQINEALLQQDIQTSNEDLREFLEDIKEIAFTESDDVETEVAPVDAVVRTYTVYQIEESLNNITYRTRLHVDNNFGRTSRDRIHNIVVTMIQRLLVGRRACFLSRVRALGSLIWERPRSRPFKHTLPYRNPAPTTLTGRASQEVDVIEAAFRFALTKRAPGLDFFVKQTRRVNVAVATINLYHYDDKFEVEINDNAIQRNSDNYWVSTMAQEVMHNLGWKHGSSYDANKAIIIYDTCIGRP